ncbi:GTP cyclohydrolase II [Caldimonas manganoxidans]|uniref:GTP cyclohydrolase II n=1 Tax=Caldimonas manganoxidans TaxID=196015 RepID=UPI00035E19F7|nr:GTP cyclohydrolase II [Caldimonas manganoxidans]
MNALTSPLATLPAQDLASERAAIRVDRAQTELKHGRVLALRSDAGSVLLAATIETLSPPRLAWLTSLGMPLRLLFTAERAAALGLGVAGSVSLPLPAGASVEQLQALGAVTLEFDTAGRVRLPSAAPDRASLGTPQPATAVMLAALTLAKRARLIPALVVVDIGAVGDEVLEAAQLEVVSEAEVRQVSEQGHLSLRRVSDAHVPIDAHDDCTLVLFRELNGDAEHVAIIVGQPDRSQPVPVRLHSSCLTGDLLGSLRCDCGDQLQRAIAHLAERGGVLLYLAQEGRGTGLGSKLRAYRLQDSGLDTIDADHYLGFRADERDFQAAVAMLKALDITRIQLLTNNPRKIEALRRGGIDVVDRIALHAPPTVHNARYLATKRERAGHIKPEDEQE